jgi:hypothetical protein
MEEVKLVKPYGWRERQRDGNWVEVGLGCLLIVTSLLRLRVERVAA